MGLEVALLEWTDGPQGEAVRLLGRCADVRIVELVQAHLRQRLGGETAQPAGTPELRVVQDDPPGGDDPDAES